MEEHLKVIQQDIQEIKEHLIKLNDRTRTLELWRARVEGAVFGGRWTLGLLGLLIGIMAAGGYQVLTK